jgi:hypothetical protein
LLCSGGGLFAQFGEDLLDGPAGGLGFGFGGAAQQVLGDPRLGSCGGRFGGGSRCWGFGRRLGRSGLSEFVEDFLDGPTGRLGFGFGGAAQQVLGDFSHG